MHFDDLDKLGIIKYDVKCFDIAQLKNLDYFMVFKGQRGLSALEKLLGKETIVGFRSQILTPGIFIEKVESSPFYECIYKNEKLCDKFGV